MGQKRYLEPIKYEVGKDISHEQYNEALEKIALFFEQTRPNEREHLSLARQAMKECLEGVTKDGQKWFGAATSSLAARVKIKCRFDITTMMPLINASDERRRKKTKEKERLKKKREVTDEYIPETLRKEMEKVHGKKLKPAYGDDPNLLLSTDEHRKWREYKEAYLRQFPAELGSIAAQAELDTLCDLHILNERHRLKLLNGVQVDPNDRKTVVDQLDKLKTSLGIHPNQLAKRIQSKTDTTIGAAAARLEQMGDWRLLRQRFLAEELLQAFQMYMTPTADGLDFQLDKVGLFSATKCMTCSCKKCGHGNFAGLGLDEVRGWLVEKGYLAEVDPSTVPSYQRPEEMDDLPDEEDEDEAEDTSEAV